MGIIGLDASDSGEGDKAMDGPAWAVFHCTGLGLLTCVYWAIYARCKHQLKERPYGPGKGSFIS